jgi:hypothetical protein
LLGGEHRFMYFYYHYRFASTDEKWYQSPTLHLS